MSVKPYCLTIDRGAPGLFFSPVRFYYETEQEAREGLAHEMETQKAEMAKAGGRCVCSFDLCRMDADGRHALAHETLTQGDFPSPAPMPPEFYNAGPKVDEAWGNMGVVAGGPQLAAMARRKQEIAERRGRGEL